MASSSKAYADMRKCARDLERQNATLRRQLDEAKANNVKLNRFFNELQGGGIKAQFTDLQREVERLTKQCDELLDDRTEADRKNEALREAATKVVDALDDTCCKGYCMMDDGEDANEAIAALRTALAQPEPDTKEDNNGPT